MTLMHSALARFSLQKDATEQTETHPAISSKKVEPLPPSTTPMTLGGAEGKLTLTEFVDSTAAQKLPTVVNCTFFAGNEYSRAVPLALIAAPTLCIQS